MRQVGSSYSTYSGRYFLCHVLCTWIHIHFFSVCLSRVFVPFIIAFDLYFFDCTNLFFVLIKFHCTFFISHIILPYYVYYYCILMWQWLTVRTSFSFVQLYVYFPYSCLSLRFFFCFFACKKFFLLHSFMSSTFPIALLNGTLFLLTISAQCTFWAKKLKYLSTSKPSILK